MDKLKLEIFDRIDRIHNENPGSEFLYRGQSNKKWNINSGFARYFSIENLNESPGDLEKYNSFFLEMGINLNDKKSMHLAQHIGRTTPLIDFTFDPFVGLYFAANKNYRTDGELIVIIRDEFPYNDRIVPCEYPTDQANAQRSCFFEGLNLSEGTKGIYSILIPSELKVELLIYLNQLNFNQDSLFPNQIALQGIQNEILKQSKSLRKASEYLSKIMIFDPESEKNLSYAGIDLISWDQYLKSFSKKALRLLDKSLSIKIDPLVFHYKALVFGYQGLLKKSIKNYKKCIGLSSKISRLDNNSIYNLNLANLYSLNNNHLESYNHLRRAWYFWRKANKLGLFLEDSLQFLISFSESNIYQNLANDINFSPELKELPSSNEFLKSAKEILEELLENLENKADPPNFIVGELENRIYIGNVSEDKKERDKKVENDKIIEELIYLIHNGLFSLHNIKSRKLMGFNYWNRNRIEKFEDFLSELEKKFPSNFQKLIWGYLNLSNFTLNYQLLRTPKKLNNEQKLEIKLKIEKYWNSLLKKWADWVKLNDHSYQTNENPAFSERRSFILLCQSYYYNKLGFKLEALSCLKIIKEESSKKFSSYSYNIWKQLKLKSSLEFFEFYRNPTQYEPKKLFGIFNPYLYFLDFIPGFCFNCSIDLTELKPLIDEIDKEE